MSRWLSLSVVAALFLASGPALAAVEVNFSLSQPYNGARDLQGMSDLRGSERSLSEFVVAEATPRLSPGVRLDITFRSVTVAGTFEAWRIPEANRIRFVTPLYAPRIELSFVLTAPDGRVIRSGDRTLTDLEFQRNALARASRDPLRYEKALIVNWLGTELPDRAASLR